MTKFASGKIKYHQVFIAFFLLLFGSISIVHAQSDKKTYNSVINISVNVLSDIKIQIVRNLELKVIADNQNVLTINPVNDPNSGFFYATGTDGAPMRIGYPHQIELINKSNNATLLFNVELSGHGENQQDQSKIYTQNPVDLYFSSKGQFYFWVGGTANIQNTPEGNYEGTIAFNIDYN